MVQLLTPTGANRNVTFDASHEVEGAVFVIANRAAIGGYSLVVKNVAASTVATLAPQDWGLFVYTDGAWVAVQVAQSALTVTSISVPDNSATAFQILEGANPYVTIDTANSSESVRIHKVLELLASGIDMSQGAAGQSVYLKDNEAAALDISEGANSYLKFVTTNSGEKVVATKPLEVTGGLTAASVFKSTEQTATGSAQTIAHGLGRTPTLAWAMVSDSGATGIYTLVPGVPDATNLTFTGTAGTKFYAFGL
jgi:hypothetical protein